MFYGRKNQKKSILDMIAKDEQMVSLIYGRRRIGKSELIKQSLRETEVVSLYYECKQTSEKNNVDSLAEIIGDTFGYPKPSFSNIEEILSYLFKRAEKQPLVLVFDEYPYLRENVKGLDSIIQSVIDKYKDASHMKFIICGSYVETMRELISKQNPLFGRVDLTIELKAMDYYESAMFYESFQMKIK